MREIRLDLILFAVILAACGFFVGTQTLPDLTVFFVGILQLIVFYFQYRAFKEQAAFMQQTVIEMKEGTKATIKAANAATLSAEAAIRIELPILRALLAELTTVNGPILPDRPYGGSYNNAIPTNFSAISHITIMNYGRTPAFPTVFAAGWKVSSELPSVPEYTKELMMSHAGVIRPDSEPSKSEYTIDADCGIELTDAEIAEVSKGTSWLWFYGSIKYFDFMNETREARFCWRWANRNPVGHKAFYFFASDGNPPKAYIKTGEKTT